MAAMLIDNHKQTILTLLQDGETLLEQIGDKENAKKLQTVWREADDKRTPAIMFYGLYNAGKSTLINALCKSDVAPTGDVPTTASIQKVPWEGYSLIDTPGINAHAEHTEIAEKEIRQSDVILFVMDNADTFDNASVYQAIVDILKMGKPLAVVINQKNVDDEEDPNIPVPDRRSVQEIVKKVSYNLEVQGGRNGMQIVGSASNFLGFFPLNALTAYTAGMPSIEGSDMLYKASGIISLRNALNESIRRSEYVYMLRTPLINLRDALQEVITTYQSTSIYGEKQHLAENRESLLASRQRLRDRLMSDGLRKIEVALEAAKAAAANGQAVEGLNEKLATELNALVQDAAKQEQGVLQPEIQLEAMPDYRPVVNSAADLPSQNEKEFSLSDVAKTLPILIDIPTVPIPIPLPLIIKVAELIIGLFTPKQDKDAVEAAHQSQERLANYYTCVNLTPRYIIEFRMFRGTLRYTTLIATLQLVENLCGVAFRLSDEDAKALTWSEFVANLEEEAVLELIQYLKERRWYVNEPVEAMEEV